MSAGLMGQREAAEYIGVNKRWLDNAPIEWLDLRKPGDSRPVKRWRKSALDAFLASRTVKPGHASPMAA